jgi:hypothetical protein
MKLLWYFWNTFLPALSSTNNLRRIFSGGIIVSISLRLACHSPEHAELVCGGWCGFNQHLFTARTSSFWLFRDLLFSQNLWNDSLVLQSITCCHFHIRFLRATTAWSTARLLSSTSHRIAGNLVVYCGHLVWVHSISFLATDVVLQQSRSGSLALMNIAKYLASLVNSSP